MQKHGQFGKRLISVLAAALLCAIISVFCVLPTAASTTNTDESDAKTVLVAGNPDLYPIEYFDSESKSYMGIMPQIYERISKNTGLQFEYVTPLGSSQSQLVKSRNADIISAHIWGKLDSTHEEYRLTKINKNGEMLDVCLGFADSADISTVTAIKKQLDSVSDEDLLALALVSKPVDESRYINLLIASSIASITAVIILAVLLIIRSRKAKAEEQRMLIDPLTGFGNEKAFSAQYDKTVPRDSRGLYYIAYIALELQRIEKYLGSTVTKELQRFAAAELKSACKDSDFSARIGDGVFSLAFQCTSDSEASAHISRILKKLNDYEDSFLDQYRMMFRAGIYHLTSPEISCKRALYNARQGYNYAAQTKIPYTFSDTAILSHEALKARLQRKLSDALIKHEFKLYVQFSVNAKNGKICGAEALSRWQNPEEGLLSPAHYIDSMKTLGIIDRFDFYILEESCRLLEKWSKTNKDGIYLSCNFTRITVSSADFAERFSEIVNRYSFNRRNLIIELTEDSLADNNERAFQNMRYCQEQGFRIALDDLGSGYTSFSDLCDYPIDIVKIDRSIVKKSVTERGFALICGITKLAHDLGIDVLCEGVENESERENAIKAGCDYIQGYYYSRVFPETGADDYYFSYTSNLMQNEESDKAV